jgi:hypothetical protein
MLCIDFCVFLNLFLGIFSSPHAHTLEEKEKKWRKVNLFCSLLLCLFFDDLLLVLNVSNRSIEGVTAIIGFE